MTFLPLPQPIKAGTQSHPSGGPGPASLTGPPFKMPRRHDFANGMGMGCSPPSPLGGW